MEEFETKIAFCKLCLGVVNGENFKVIDEVIKGVLNELRLMLREQKNETFLICNACFTRLFAAFNFKSVCTDTEDRIISYVNSKSRTPVDLKEIYLKERQNEQLKGISGDERICRLCMQRTYEFTSAKEIDLDTFRTYIPEVNFTSTKEPVVCKVCLNSMDIHTAFLKNCLNTGEKNKNISDYNFLENPFHIDTGEIEIKSEDSCGDSFFPNIEEGSLGDSRRESVASNMDHFNVRMYRCDSCSYKTARRPDFKIHKLKHKNITEEEIYKCDVCDYKTIYQGSYTKHLLKHIHIPEKLMYKCDVCNYKTGYMVPFIKHRQRHEIISKDLMYKCNLCNFKSHHLTGLSHHQLKHRYTAKVQMYKCDSCDYTSIYKNHILRHQLIHIDIPEEEIYQCDLCEYKIVYKAYFVQHLLRYKHIQTYKCDWCDYKTIRKNYLAQHQLRHKILMYRCRLCYYTTNNKESFIEHRWKHKHIPADQMFKCNLCEYTTSRKVFLEKHMLSHESHEERLDCHQPRDKSPLRRRRITVIRVNVKSNEMSEAAKATA